MRISTNLQDMLTECMTAMFCMQNWMQNIAVKSGASWKYQQIIQNAYSQRTDSL